jgi:hypothetical protein
MLPTIAGMTGVHHYAQLLLEMGSYECFAQGWPRTTVLPISDSQLARIIGLSHQHLAKKRFKKNLKMFIWNMPKVEWEHRLGDFRGSIHHGTWFSL